MALSDTTPDINEARYAFWGDSASELATLIAARTAGITAATLVGNAPYAPQHKTPTNTTEFWRADGTWGTPADAATNFAEGTLAGRPAAATFGIGTYFATDDNGGTYYGSDGSAWAKLARGLSEAVLLSTVTTKGDVLAATGSGALARVAVAGDGLPLIGDAASAAGVKFAALPESSVTNLTTDLAGSVLFLRANF